MHFLAAPRPGGVEQMHFRIFGGVFRVGQMAPGVQVRGRVWLRSAFHHANFDAIVETEI